LGNDDNAAAIMDRQMAGLLRTRRKIAHDRGREGNQPADRRMEMRQPEHFQRQRESIAVKPLHITPAHQPVQHAVKLVGALSDGLGDLDLCQPAIGAGQKFENVQALVEGGSAISFAVVVGHLASMMMVCMVAGAGQGLKIGLPYTVRPRKFA